MYAIKLETPQLAAPAAWDGYITQVYSAEVIRAINRAGTFTCSFPLSANQASLIRRGWYVTIIEERFGLTKSDGSAFTSPLVLYRGKVLRRTVIINHDGSSSVELSGETPMGGLANHYIQGEREYASKTLDYIVNDLLSGTGFTYSVPTRCTTDKLSTKINDTTVLQALIQLARLTRTNLVDTFTDAIKFTDENDVPEPATNLNVDESTVYVINMEGLSQDTRNAALGGFAVVSVPPTISYDGTELVNRLKVVGVDFNGEELTLQDATGGNYSVQSAVGTGGATYYYIEDTASVDRYGRVERQLVRSDITNPADSAATKTATKTVLLAIGCGELLRRRSEIFTAQVELINGEDIYVLAGERVKLRYKGNAILRDTGATTVLDLDFWCLVTRRYDKITPSGVRLVGLDLSTPELSLTIPDLPDIVTIPTPLERQLPPEKPPGEDRKPEDPTKGSTDPDTVQHAMDQANNIGDYQPCCNPPTGTHPEGGIDDTGGIPMPVLCSIGWDSAALQDIRFVNKWGNGWANPGLVGGFGELQPGKDYCIIVLVSSSADPVFAVSGATIKHELHWDSATPANFGGDGHGWWALAVIEPTADLIDFTGTTGAQRMALFARASRAWSSVESSVLEQLSYTGSHFAHAEEDVSVDQSVAKDDFMALYIGDAVRTIDNIEIDKRFHSSTFNYDHTFINAEPIPIFTGGGVLSSMDWLLSSSRVDSVTAGEHVTADFNVAFPGSTRCLATAASVKLHAVCASPLIV